MPSSGNKKLTVCNSSSRKLAGWRIAKEHSRLSSARFKFKTVEGVISRVSFVSSFSLSRTNVPRDKGGLGQINYPLLSDITHAISKAYGVYLEDLGHSLRYLQFVLTEPSIF